MLLNLQKYSIMIAKRGDEMRKLEINIVIGGGGNRVVALVTSYSHISFKARESFFSRF